MATDNFMPHVLWTNYFLDQQGYNAKETLVYQYNKNAILLEQNGNALSSKRTKHINIRYFHYGPNQVKRTQG